MTDVKNHANLVWGIAELLRGDYEQADYGNVILPLVVIRWLDQALEETKAKLVAQSEQLRAQASKTSKLALNLGTHLRGFSSLAREVFEKFEFAVQIDDPSDITVV